MNINKVSQSISSQSPDFLRTEYPLFNKFIEYYYRSQEKTGLGQNILNNFLQYLDIDKLDIGILDGKTKLVESIGASDDTIVVESVDEFLSENGSILIGDEVIFYERVTNSPNIALSPGISYDQVKEKWLDLAQLINSFDGVETTFPLTSQSAPISPPSAQHLIVKIYGETLNPNIDYTILGSNIVFTNPPREKLAGDDASETSIVFLDGFVENSIVFLDNISGSFGEGVTEFTLTKDGVAYEPVAEEYILAVYNNQLLIPKVDFFIDKSTFIFSEAPLNGRFLSLYSIEAPIPSFGSGGVGYSRVNDSGEITDVSVNETGSGYRYEYPPKVTIQSESGSGAAVTTLINGIKNVSLLNGGVGYSDTNPPIVVIEEPTVAGSKVAELKATVVNGSVSSLEVVSSGSGYTFTPRVSFKQPGGAKIGPATIVDGRVEGQIEVINGGEGYTTAPRIYIDAPTGTDGIIASLQAVITDGKLTSIQIVNPGQGYETVPRVAVIEPTGAQVLETLVDGDGRVVSIELLDGGIGYEDIPSVYIVDPSGNGSGATATASVFNGRITDINITNFGSGYSVENPPTIVIQSPPPARASVEIGLNEITGFSVNKSGRGYSKAKFEGCARAASGITSYTETGNAVFSNNTTAASAVVDTEVKCLDALFVKRLLDKYTEQFLPDVPELDYKKINVRTAIKSVKDFYSTKGTSFSVAYLFKLLYGEEVTVSYPKDQIIKPSNATWSIDTILRATLVSGNPTDIRDGVLTQDESIADPNIKSASALVENYISIKTSETELFELVLSEETIEGTFTVPYKTKLAEPLDTQTSIITVDSTIGWPERNGEFIIGGTELVRYKEKSLNQFIECTRSVNGVVEDWDSATEISSNLTVYVNKGTEQEVVLNVVGIVDAEETTLTDTGSYYLAGDKLTVSKLGGTSIDPELNTWLYNVKKLIEVESITFGGINNRFATVTCSNNHGLLVGDQVTVYGANPILYNGTFLVTSRDSATVFQYELPQPAEVVPQGNILVSVDLNKGKSENSAILNSIGPYTTNIQNSFFNDDYVYVASTGIPNYNIGPFPGSALLPGNQRKLNRFPLAPSTISTKNLINPGPIGTWVNGVSIWSYKSDQVKTFGPITSIDTLSVGDGYDAASPPTITIENGGGTGATANVTVNGSITEIVVNQGGSGYTSSPLVSIVGGGGSGASATAIVTRGVVSRILINDGGSGYTSEPSITIVGGGGTGATAQALVRGPIQSISVTDGGSSYTSEPDVILSSGSGAVAQAIVNNGRIISIAIISAGQGYTTAPEVAIFGDGFGAVARATIDVDGENAGRVTNIEILNRGIGYSQGSTLVTLTSVGSGATFKANVFEWTYNLQETTQFDSAKGAVFAGYNNQYGGEYAHLSNPQKLRFILGDNLFESITGSILEQETQLEHSPIIGWAFDGNPIYGPYGYSDPTDQGSSIARLNSSYALKSNLVFDSITNPIPVRTEGPLLSDEPAGKFIEDYEYQFGLGDLDQYNGRFCKTPEYPNGRYCYFVTIDTTEAGNPVFPYVLGPSYNSVVDLWNLNKDAIQQNIPRGVVRFRDPYENVDIDVDRAPNASTNALTLENGDILLFEVEDENRDGIIDQAELDDPDQIFEESPLQLFDYFPKVKVDSKVDIEVETITKFENASVDGFIIEDPGTSYQVDDILVFDNTNTDGTGVSARISRVTGETVSSYTFENIQDTYYGVLSTSQPHNIVAGDQIFVDYIPIMDNTNKQFVVRQLRGVEEIVINQTGSGYTTELPPTITITGGGGESASLEAVVTSVGSIEQVNIINSGSGYTSDPRVIVTHPQIFKKAEYFATLISNENYVKVNDVFVNSAKETFVCGLTLDNNGNEVAFLSKFAESGIKEWEKTLESQTGENYTEFVKLNVNGNDIWVVGLNKPNSLVLSSYNPDVILVKYVQAIDGLSATIDFQKGYAGISGSTRADFVTSIDKYSDSRFVIGGYTNTNSSNPYDAFIATIDSTGGFAAKRKIASVNRSEKLTGLVVKDGYAYFTLEIAPTQESTDVRIGFGKALIGTNVITIEWIKELTSSAYSFYNTSLSVDDFDEFYISATAAIKATSTKDSFWVGKLDASGDLIWNYRYAAQFGHTIELADDSEIDIFGDFNIAYTETDDTTGQKSVNTAKIGFDGTLKTHTSNIFTENRIEGITVNALTVDNSGDVYTYGQTSWNRNEFIFEFAETDDATDKTGHYTPTLIGNDATDALTLLGDGVAKLFGYDVATPANWENAAIEFSGTNLGTTLAEDWTIEFMIYHDSSNSNTLSQTQQTLVSIGDASDSTGGVWMYYDMLSGRLECIVTNNTTSVNSAGSALQSTQVNLYAQDSWQFVALKKESDTFTGYVNGIQVFNGTISDTSLGNKDLRIGQVAGRSGTPGQFRSLEQGQYYLDNLRLRNRAVVPTVPSDVTALPPTSTFALAYDWVDDTWFTANLNRYDYIDYVGWGLKTDKNSDAIRLGTVSAQTNTGIGFTRAAITPVTPSSLTIVNVGFALGEEGLQALDYEDATTTMQDDTLNLTYASDVWSSRTATVPSPGAQKLMIEAKVKNRYYIKVADTIKIDNVQELTINQDFRFTVGSKLVLNNDAGSFVNSGYILRVDEENDKVYLAVNNNDWTNDLNTGRLSTAQFDESSTYGIVGKAPNDINEIFEYIFDGIVNTTPGTFDIALEDFNLDRTAAASAGTGNLDEYGVFKPFDANLPELYRVRIDEVSGVSSPFIPGSVVTITSSDISFNSDYNTVQITNLTGVLKITLITDLSKILQVTAVANTDEVYVITGSRHYYTAGSNILIDGNPSQQIGSTVYDEYDGSFVVDRVISSREFVYKLPQAALTSPATTAANVSIFGKSPVLKMYYGHQYLFDLSHSSMVGSNLSFSKDNLYKLEYSFNSIERIGTPGVTGEGQPTPTVKLKVDRDIVTNISYYFDPSRSEDDSPIDPKSYLDIVDSPYVGPFTISEVAGETITTGPNILKFVLANEPEGSADASRASYSTSSKKAVSSIADIRIINKGGFYSKLPVITDIISNRQIERVQINEPGTEYAVGVYQGVPINGDGEGGLVEITVADGTTDEGVLIPGQIQRVAVTSPGKGYTTAFIDIEAIEGILGPGLTGSGAELEVVIPPFGSGAVVFTKGTNVGKIKKLKNNNFGYDYTHDYTLRPEITFPINAQLTSTNILDSISVTDPGSGYSQAPAVIITGGGGSGAIAEASIKNGRIDQIVIKDPGAGYSSAPTVELKSSFNYVVNVDLGLLQFAFPHGIQNGAEVTLNVIDTGDGAEFPLAAGALGRLNASTTYYAIAGTAQSLEDDQLKLAITETNAELGDAIGFVNAGTGRQQVLTSSFGAAAEAKVVTSTFLEGELVYQGDTFDTATATGFVSTNSGWQVGPRILKIVDYTGEFIEGERVTGVISKSSGIISDLKIAKGVLEIGSITQTTGQFIDDVGKPSEIIQKIQDSYYYQDFSYAVKSSVSIDDWKDILIRNVHPASFKVFGELNLDEYAFIPNKETDFELTKSVELTRDAIVPNIQSFTLVEPIYSEFNNTEVLFRQKRLTSSENILTSVVQRLDDISSLFDGETITFPLTVDGDPIIANAGQLLIILNGVAQTPNKSFEVVGDSIVFKEAPKPPASVKYVSVGIELVDTIRITFVNTSGIFPLVGNSLRGLTSNARLTVTAVEGQTISGFVTEGEFLIGELCTVGATGFLGTIGTTYTHNGVTNSNRVTGTYTVSGVFGSIAGTDASFRVEVSLDGTPTVTLLSGGNGFVTGETLTIPDSQLGNGGAPDITVTFGAYEEIQNIGLFSFNEQISNLEGNTAVVERINLERGQETPIAKLRYTIGAATTSIEVVSISSETDAPVPEGTFELGQNYQFASEIVTVTEITPGNDSTTIVVTRGVSGTAATSHQEDTPVYGTEIEITDALILSKTTGTYQSTPGLFDIQLNDVIVGSQSGVVARITSTSAYQDPTTGQFIEQVNISDGSSFFGLLFNRITSTTYPNVILDDISTSQVGIVRYDDNSTAFNSNFPSNELISNNILIYDNESGDFTENEYIRNYRLRYGGKIGDDFAVGENLKIRKLTFTDQLGTGLFSKGQIIRSRDTKAEVIGYNQSRKTIYVGKVGRTKNTGEDYHYATFVADAELNVANKKYGDSCLALSKGTSPHTFVSGATDAIAVTGGAEGPYTAATGTTYDPISGELVLEIGAHTLTTSDTIQIADDGITFTCSSDGNVTQLSHPRAGQEQSGQTLAITAVTATTITVDGGAVPVDEYLTIPTSTEFGFGTGDFTLELWIKPNSVASGSKVIADFRPTSSDIAPLLILSGSTLQYQSYLGAGNITGSTNLVANTWYHIAVVRESGVTKMYLDGVQEGSDLADTTDYGSTRPIKIGANLNGGAAFPGYIDDLRVSTVARYTAAFTAPKMHQGDTDTVLLLSFDGEQGQQYTQDWSGGESFTNGEQFHNDAILETSRVAGAPSGFNLKSHRYYNAAEAIDRNKEFIAEEASYVGKNANLTYVLDTTSFTEISASDRSDFDNFGRWSVSVGKLPTDNKIVVGAVYDDDTFNSSGSAYIFDLDGTNEIKINALDPGSNDNFGYATAVGNGKIAVGAPYHDLTYGNRGAVYVCDLDGTNMIKIIGNGTATNSYFGTSLAISDNKLIVGARGYDNFRGGVWVMDLDGTNQQIIQASDASSSDQFGYHVDADNGKIIVGSLYDDDRGGSSGSAYIFNLDGTGQVKLVPSDGASSDYFGTSVGISGDRCIVGAPYDDDNFNSSGSAYLYTTTGTLIKKITASDPANSDHFGSAVAIGQGNVFVGARYAEESTATQSSGILYIYDIDGENEIKQAVFDQYDNALEQADCLAVGNNVVVAGVGYSDPGNINGAGSAYIWNYLQTASVYNYSPTIIRTLEALVQDIRNGSNSFIWDNAATFVDRTELPIAGLTAFAGEEAVLEGVYNQVKDYLDEIVNNVLIPVTGPHGLTQWTDATVIDSSYPTITQLTPTTATYDPATGDFVITVAGHGLTTNDRISLAPGSFRFTCDSDGNDCVLSHPRVSDTAAYNSVLAITAVTTDTFTVNVGASPADAQFAHTFVSVDTDAVTVLDYTTADCADVVATVNNLMDIAIDTIAEANETIDVAPDNDHLATVTKVEPATVFVSGTVDSYYENDLQITYNDSLTGTAYTHQLAPDARNRFYDAADLITANSAVIIDKTSYDLLQQYPDLAQEMPRNEDGTGNGTLRCETDLSLILAELVKDIRYGGNLNTVTAAKFYISSTGGLEHIRLQVHQSVYAHKRMAEYMKQAITGDLTYDNTDAIIVGDWDITQDPSNPQCADVQSAIDTLIALFNDIIAPTGTDYEIAGDRLYFNRKYISAEIAGTLGSPNTDGLLTNILRYDIGTSSYSEYTYDVNTFRDYIQDICIALVSDLQTGGTESVILELEKFLTTELIVIPAVEDKLYIFSHVINELRELVEKAIRNLLYANDEQTFGDQYNSQFPHTVAPYRDALTPTDIDAVVCRARQLIDKAEDVLVPAGTQGRSAVENIVYNTNYYKQEIAQIVGTQFGANSWQYDSFIDELVDNIEYDLLTTDTGNTQTAYTITLESYTGNFQLGETVTNGSGSTATVLFSTQGLIVVGAQTPSAFNANDGLTGSISLETAVIAQDGISLSYDWYNNISNVKTIESATTISSLVEGSIINQNLWVNPESFENNWTLARVDISANTGTAPDGTSTADKMAVELNNSSSKLIYRSYNLTAYQTFDATNVRFDSDTTTFDLGANDSTQIYTMSMFIKSAEYERIRFRVDLDNGSKYAFFDVNLADGTIGSLFNSTDGITILDHGVIPFGDGWYRVYLTSEFGFGFSSIRNLVYILSANGALFHTGVNNDTKIVPFDNSSSAYFGHSISVGDGKVLIGAYNDQTNGIFGSGSAFVSDLDGSNLVRIEPSTQNQYGYFGWAVASGSGKLVVSAYREDVSGYESAGAVYIYDQDGSNEVRIVKPGNIVDTYEYFGYSVAIEGERIYVGAIGVRVSGFTYDRGAVYVFDLDGNYISTILPSDGFSYDNFGYSIATGNGKLAVGAPYDDDGGNSSGSVYVYDLDGTNEVKINNTIGTISNQQFGRVVTIGENKLGIGSLYADNLYTNSGRAWICNLDGTGLIEIPRPSNVQSNDNFGYSISIGGGKVVVGAPWDESDYRGSAGVVYMFDLDGTNETQFTAYDLNYSDNFGSAVVLSGGKLYVGARYDDDAGGNSGSVYIIDATGGPGVFVWGAKLTNQLLGTYLADSGEEFYANAEFNIKKYSIALLQDYIQRALNNNLQSPAPSSGFLSYYNSVAGAAYDSKSIMGVVRGSLNIINNQLKDSTYYTTVTGVNGLSRITKNYGTRSIPVGITGQIAGADFVYSIDSNTIAELQTITLNEGKIVKVFERIRIGGDIVNGPYVIGDTVEKQGDSATNGVIYAIHTDENFTYLDLVTSSTWNEFDVVVGSTGNNPTGTISGNIEKRLQVIDVLGSFDENISFKGYTSTQTAEPVEFIVNSAAVTDNTGGVLTVDTETLQGTLEITSVVYPESSREYVTVSKISGLDLQVGDRIASTGHIRLGYNFLLPGQLDTFSVGHKLHRILNGVKQENVYGVITEVDEDNNYLYVVEVEGNISQGDTIGDYGLGGVQLEGFATAVTKVSYAGAGSAVIQDIRESGLNKRLYLTNIVGAINDNDGIRGPNSNRSAVLEKEVLYARVSRFFRGFDGVQTTFDLSSNNGVPYFPDPEGHMLIFVNGVLQPPDASYNAFSDKIQFTEPPDLGASFTGFYVGKLRQLDDISFEFDSLRQSFNLRRNDAFYSLTLTDGVQSSTIRPENNIIVSVNGVLQEPGVGFEIVGSRIIFSEIPRVGSTFVAFSYVGSEADVDAEEVVPPVEVGDLIEIEGETEDREVAVIESSNSLITFDYLGSVFGQGAIANVQLTSGYIDSVQITSGGSGYTSRPTVRLDSISGFDGQIKALVGVAGVTVTNPGSGYKNPTVQVETTVPDDWTAPDLSQYGEEVIDPEILP